MTYTIINTVCLKENKRIAPTYCQNKSFHTAFVARMRTLLYYNAKLLPK